MRCSKNGIQGVEDSIPFSSLIVPFARQNLARSFQAIDVSRFYFALIFGIAGCQPSCCSVAKETTTVGAKLAQRHGVERFVLSGCQKLAAFAPPDCEATVRANFDRCDTTTEHDPHALMRCLGFRLPRDGKVSAEDLGFADCVPPHVRLKVSCSLAERAVAGEVGSRNVNGAAFRLSGPQVFSDQDVIGVRLATDGSKQQLQLKLTPEAQRRIADATGSNVGGFMLTTINGKDNATQISGKIDGDTVEIALYGPSLLAAAAVCDPNH